MAEEAIRRATASIGRTKYRTTITTEGGITHELIADEPKVYGGADLGPTPLEMFLGSIGACKAMTARMYADRKGWPLDEAICTVSQQLRPAEDGGRKVPHIDIEIQFTGDLDDDQRQRLHEIAERCPVQQMVTGECIVKTHLVTEV